MAAQPDSVIQELSRLHISHMTPQQYSPLRGKKIAPVVPPKPKKVTPAQGLHGNSHVPDATYANLSAPPPVMPCKAEPQASPATAFERHAVVSAAALDSTDPLPPPPPPPTLGRIPSYSASQQQQTCRSASYSEDLPPPSPPRSPDSLAYGTAQSSSASFHHFRPQSSASTYDSGSIYEPIVPRPPSQMSGYSSTGSSLYSSYYPGRMGTGHKSSNHRGGQEAEVDHLTDLLVQSMESSGDPDFFEDDEPPVIGMCYKCGEKVLGEGSGCTAMDQVYHIKCFTCHVCMKELRGKPFFAMEGKPYCEDDYLNTLEKCCVCEKPILDRILRATGKPYHPACFRCVVCGQCLDGIPFTVDATSRVHCIDDFHKKFAPRCCVCSQPIMPEPGKEETVRVVALDRSFHINCYRCEDCGLLLSSEAEGRGCYPLDDHILCRSCNARRVQALTSRMVSEL
ncbi:lipoma-preferred partner zyxin isoform X1 [Rhipicephalus microplus]|uniref:lipoma-preferred partner zyxin isoform X1 n=1 Tax=Rhipicephalus microplus TaxID=6941 RepID=UPI003F6D0F0F